MEKLFSYGTLQLPQVQESLFGRILAGTKEGLPGYKVEKLKITDQAVIEKSGTDMHPILVRTGEPADVVAGMVFEITQVELEKADEYEVDDYRRTLATMRSGIQAWIYCSASG
ncbi:MAG: gamma-glutamylcyclotransferase [Opitutae bacterium]|nr:gamma-glutamylcyclotransferase [Opitutae bacterium]